MASQTEVVVEAATKNAIERCVASNSYPMWTVTDKVSKLVPNPRALPTIWNWQEMRQLMMETSALVPEEMAERRALMMVNPGFRKFTIC